MTNEDPQAVTTRTRVLRRARTRPVVLSSVGVVIGVVLVSVLLGRSDSEEPTTPASDSPATSAAPMTTGPNLETELIERLQGILAERDEAYRRRDPAMLKTIYTVDCPCLESDSNAIKELLSKDYVWVGGETSIRVRRTEQVSSRLWLIIADFDSSTLRIETESGRLVRAEPSGSDLFQFALARPPGSSGWLLGRATSYEDG
jgi:hypothetical protein